MVNKKSISSFVASTFVIFILVCAHSFGADATVQNKGQLSERVAKAICTVTKKFATSTKIQPPLNDASKFSNENDAHQPCQRLQWKTCAKFSVGIVVNIRRVHAVAFPYGGGDCQKFEFKDCPAPDGSKPQIKTRRLTAKIVGGTEADPYEFPHQVLFYIPLPPFDDIGRCGGSILDEETILSAGHCFYGIAPEGVLVTAGEHEISAQEGPEQNRTIKSIVVHERYNKTSRENDIALLKLTYPLALSRKVRPIRLADTNFVIPDMATVTGWGTEIYGGKIDDVTVLRKVDVPIVLWEECKKEFEGEKTVIMPTNICAGVEDKDSCQGDSGGPLAVKDANGQFTQIGIVSIGIGCGTMPGIYTLIPEYIDWINENIT